MMAWPRRNPPNDRPIACSRSRASSAYRGGTRRRRKLRIDSLSMTMNTDSMNTIRTLPTTPMLATAACWSGPTRSWAVDARPSRKALAWVTRSTWPKPSPARRFDHGWRIVGSSCRRVGTFRMNSRSELNRACARMTTTARTAIVRTA